MSFWKEINLNKNQKMTNSITKTKIKINRLLAQKAALQHKMKKQENSKRKARTRTLIQLGGLLDLTPLLAICNIELGEDLQLDHPDKSATLLGILSHFCDKLPKHLSAQDLAEFKSTGKNLLKESR